jgi:hypothetical protein
MRVDRERSMADRRRFHFRAFISFFVLVSALVITVGGVMLYVSPPGRIANWTDWRILGLTKTQWQEIHTIFALLFVVTAGIHTYLNWRVLLSYLRDRVRGGMRRGRELAAAGLAAVVVFGMTLRDAPPFSSVLAFGERLSYSWDVAESQPPVPSAEELHLEAYAAVVGLEPQEVTGRLDSLGLGPWDPGRTLGDVAASLGLAPRALAEQIGGRTGAMGGAGRGGRAAGGQPIGSRDVGAGAASAGAGLADPGSGTGTGFGRLTVEAFCAQEEVPVAEALARLRRIGVTARAGDRIRDLATQSGREPADLAGIMRGF